MGLMSMLVFQALIHIGVNIRLLPTTGMTLPFLSYGGSSLLGSSLIAGMILNFTNNKKNIILKTKMNNIWLFKSNTELIIEDSILVDNNITKPTKQIVIKGVLSDKKIIEKWSLEKI